MDFINKIIDNILGKRKPDIYLRKYIRKTCFGKLDKCSDLLSSNEALKHFGKMWGEFKPDTMMVLTSLEYQYISDVDYEFTEKELRAIRWFIGNFGEFLKGCKQEHDQQVKNEEERAIKAQSK